MPNLRGRAAQRQRILPNNPERTDHGMLKIKRKKLDRQRTLAWMAAWPNRQKGGKLRIVAGGALGDGLLHTPFIRHFKKSGRYDHIACVVPAPAAPIFYNNPYIDQLIPCAGDDILLWAAPEAGWDIFCPYFQVETVCSAQGETTLEYQAGWLRDPDRTNLSLMDQIAENFGLHLQDHGLDIFPDSTDQAWAREFLTAHDGRPCIAIATGTKDDRKRYPHPLWQAVVDALHDEIRLFQFSSTGALLSGVEPIVPLPSMGRSAALFARMACIVCVDSFPAHLASAVGTPAVVLFGPSDPAKFGHHANMNLRVSDCPPCSHPHEKPCASSRCMAEISPQKIVAAVKKLIFKNR